MFIGREVLDGIFSKKGILQAAPKLLTCLLNFDLYDNKQLSYGKGQLS
jgi:hypothetical protein